MGANGSVEADAPINEHFFGLVNFGNTCYVNSVLQALYFCKPFREKIIQYKLNNTQKFLNASNNSLNVNSSIGSLTTTNDAIHGGAAEANGNGLAQANGSVKSDAKTTTNLGNNSNNLINPISSNSSAQNISISKQEHLLNCLAELFYSIVTMKKKKGVVQPKKFIARLRKDNESFDNFFQQDAHEFLNYLLNTCADILKAEMKEMKELQRLEEQNRLNETSSGGIRFSTKIHRTLNKSIGNQQLNNNSSNHHNNNNNNNHQQQQNSTTTSTGNEFLTANSFTQRNSSNNGSARSSTHSQTSQNSSSKCSSSNAGADQASTAHNTTSASNSDEADKEELTWIHELFQGILVNETKCLNCDTSSSKEENFLDLSVDVDQNTSISHCLQEFSNMEMLCGECKYYCENCASKQEAEKRMRIKKLPKVLALHLKRFKYVGVQNKFKKLTYRVVFPFELRLFNTTEDCSNSDRVYDLVSFVVHCGMGLNRGHYISVVKSHGYWFLFDDEQVEKIEISNFEEFYGLTQDTNKKSETCYILFYESRQT